ncbi:hypothetical protein N836_33530 [Leptolyngbya sp. Heron Island J]|uniref:hypothetical protein n=1 Tax=Leptolyngbya sp. Heron Island J TaxID=1385935 RepID=UPI0003B97C71|nr:hypothetical protein [Leptolyngbya sp. Heron Island J]ESA38017.1 hypothetical protein N836_33530 [Leptolyngbya sp. Heron Island J]
MRHLPTLVLTTLLLSSPLHRTVAQPNAGTISSPETTITETERLPDIVSQQVHTDLAQILSFVFKNNITIEDISIDRYSRETWSDSCLGLGGPAESCLATPTEGWQIEAIYQGQSFFYHTDLSGNQIRRSTLDNNLPSSLQTRLLQTAEAAGFGEDLSIVEAQPKLWDSCYGLPTTADICSAIGIYGWQAIVTDGDHYWIYHTDNLGNTIRLNDIASTNTAVPTFINDAEFEELGSETTFYSNVMGGIIGLTTVSRLNNDGELLVYSHSPDQQIHNRNTANISPQQLDGFYNQLTENNFNSFNGLLYLPKVDAADYGIVTLTNGASQVAFADFIFSDVPPQLQTVTQGWEALQAETKPMPTIPVADNSQTELSENIQTQVRTNLANHLGISVDQITIQSYSRQTWSDGCLGLGGPAELCLAALTEGWQVEAVDTDTNQTYVYRTNLNGDQIRREP